MNRGDRPGPPVCDECAAEARNEGGLVRKHNGYLWGLPVFTEGDDGILDSSVIQVP